MRKKKTHWNDKIKLAMCELEGKMQKDFMAGGNERVWPAPDQVEAWTAQRQREKSSSRYCGSQHCGSSVPSEYRTKEEQKRKGFVQNVLMQVAKSAAFALATVALIQGVVKVLPDSITVSSSVGGRELPIYCVETDKKQVALSFDAAWGNDWLMERDFRAFSARESSISTRRCALSFGIPSAIKEKLLFYLQSGLQHDPQHDPQHDLHF